MISDYAIEGTPATMSSKSDCHFIYRSTSSKTGKINSPRYPSAYPNSITCIYEFISSGKEFIMLSFDTFDVEQISHEFVCIHFLRLVSCLLSRCRCCAMLCPSGNRSIFVIFHLDVMCINLGVVPAIFYMSSKAVT